MIIVALLIGFVLIAAAIRNTQGQLFGALGTDLPAYVIWAAAIVAVAAIGFVPGLKTPSRYLLALVIVVLVLNNYQAILAGFAAVSSPSAAGGTAPAKGAASPPASPQAGAATPSDLSTQAAGGDRLALNLPQAGQIGPIGEALGQFGPSVVDMANSFGNLLASGGGGP